WITTLEDGLYYIPSMGFNFIDQGSGLSSNKVLAMALLKGELYCMAADFTLNKFDVATQKVSGSYKLPYAAWDLASSDQCLLVSHSIPYIFNPENQKQTYIYWI